MRVPKSWIPSMADRVLESLLTEDIIIMQVDKDKLLVEIEALITEELSVEDRLNDEVRLILKKYESEIEKGRLDFRKLFDITKQKIVRERNIVL